MTEGHIKENLSFHYLGAIITRSGAKLERPFTDYGVDAVIEYIDKVNLKYGMRYVSSGISFDVQLKSTTEKGITITNDVLKYDLLTKNYNDLIRRFKKRDKTFGTLIPLVFVLVVLPSDEKEWLKISEEGGMKLGGNAYWYYPKSKENISKNSFTMRLEIPLENKIQMDFPEKMFQILYPKLFLK